MEIKLNKLCLKNFKGVRQFELNPKGCDCNISGINGSGKTTCFDASEWVLFGKNSEGSAQFGIKTIDADGEPLHNLEHGVTMELDVDGDPIKLSKFIKENYVKKRGSATSEFQGHKTDYAIDDVPLQEKDWNKRLAKIIADEEILRLVTNPFYFNSPKIKTAKKQSDWQRRREILFEVAGINITDQDIIESNMELKGLPDILGKHSIDDYRGIIGSRKTKINERLKEIPARIDELDKSLPDLSEYPNVKTLEKEIKDLDEKIQAAKDDKDLSSLRSKRIVLANKNNELQDKILEIRRSLAKDVNNEIETLEDKLSSIKREMTNVLSDIDLRESAVSSNEVEMSKLREKFKEEQSTTFKPMPPPTFDTSKCPNCDYILNAEENNKRLEEYERDKKLSREKFNTDQARRLTKINEQGVELKKKNEELKPWIEKLYKDKEKLEKSIQQLTSDLETASKRKDNILQVISPDERKIQDEIDLIADELASLYKQIEDNKPVDTSVWETQRKEYQTKLAEIEASKKTKARIKELGKEEKKLAAEYEKLEGHDNLIEKFITTKISMVETPVNDKFKIVTWRMFEKQINGGIREICEPLLYGKTPYSDASTGEKIVMGLDIISTLQDHYNIKAPCWIDRRESLTIDYEMDCQLIGLIANKNFKEMEVSYEQKEDEQLSAAG